MVFAAKNTSKKAFKTPPKSRISSRLNSFNGENLIGTSLFRSHVVIPVKEEPALPHHPSLTKLGEEAITERLKRWTFSAECTKFRHALPPLHPSIDCLIHSFFVFIDSLHFFAGFSVVDHSNIYISPAAHCRLTSWNLTSAEPMPGPTWQGRATYFVFLVAGYEAGKTKFDKVFSLELEVCFVLF